MSDFEHITLAKALEVRRCLTTETRASQRDTPDKGFMFVRQARLLCHGIGTTLFLAGLVSVVISPLAIRPVWGHDAKVCQLGLVKVYLLTRW